MLEIDSDVAALRALRQPVYITVVHAVNGHSEKSLYSKVNRPLQGVDQDVDSKTVRCPDP
jgi:hypothetical protein